MTKKKCARLFLVALLIVFFIFPKTTQTFADYAQKSSEESYTVKKGDTLWDISEKYYGTGFKYTDIAVRNNLQDPSAIEVGLQLVIPSIRPPIPILTPGPNINKQTEKNTGQRSWGKARPDRLEKYLTVAIALLGVQDHRLSLYFQEIGHDKRVGFEAFRSWIPASTIKSYVVLEAFRQKRLGLISFDQVITIKGEDVVSTAMESDDFPRLREGVKATIRQLVEAMIIQSDNTAYNTLLDILDRRNINSTLRNLGITETVVGEKLNLDDFQFQEDLRVPGRQSDTTTAKDMATLFNILLNKKVPDADEMLSIFKRQKFNDMIPALLPKGTNVAHKTGVWDPNYHDGGIIYKKGDPFILTVFTNSGDPAVIAKLAQVAYYQNAASVVKNPVTKLGESSNRSDRPIYFLASTTYNANVLGAKINEKFPPITAEDLGITTKDFGTNPQLSDKIHDAFITPNSFLYRFKKLFEGWQISLALGRNQKIRTYLKLANNRLAEIKSLLKQGDLNPVSDLLNDSEEDLKKAALLTQKEKDTFLITEIKQLSNLHFALLAQNAKSIPESGQDRFIDSVYDFYQKNNKELVPIVNAVTITNPTQERPIIGTITQVTKDQATLQAEDGTVKKIILTKNTPLRFFQEDTIRDINNLKQGSKVAIIGITKNSQIVPQFILQNIPKDLPVNHKGIVVEIDPNANRLKLINRNGQEEIVILNQASILKARDTNISLEGIKVGSQVTIFGTQSDIKLPSGNGILIPTSNPTSITTPGDKSHDQQNPSSSSNSTTSQSKSEGSDSTFQKQSSNAPPGSYQQPVQQTSQQTSTVQQTTQQSSQQTATSQQTTQQSNQQQTSTTQQPINATSVTVTNNDSGVKEQTKSPEKSTEKSKGDSSPKDTKK